MEASDYEKVKPVKSLDEEKGIKIDRVWAEVVPEGSFRIVCTMTT